MNTLSVGRITYDELKEDLEGYVVDEKCLVDLQEKDLYKSKDNIISKIANIFEDVTRTEGNLASKVDRFYIGKAFLQKGQVDLKNPDSWSKQEIASQWYHYSQEPYAADGLVAVAIVTEKAIPAKSKNQISEAEYASAIIQQLYHHYKIVEGDKRLSRESYPSTIEISGSASYAICVAFKLRARVIL